MNTLIKKIGNSLRAFSDVFNTSRELRYLSQATDHADLERRINSLRYGTFHSPRGGRL